MLDARQCARQSRADISGSERIRADQSGRHAVGESEESPAYRLLLRRPQNAPAKNRTWALGLGRRFLTLRNLRPCRHFSVLAPARDSPRDSAAVTVCVAS